MNRKSHRERWWIYGDKRPALYEAITGLDRVIAIAASSRVVMPAFVRSKQVLSHRLVVFPHADDAHFGILSSALHGWWARFTTGPLASGSVPNYAPTDVFETFAQPEPPSGPAWESIDAAGRALNEFRADLMTAANLGITKTYNRVHNPDEDDPDIVGLRHLHVELDHAVRDAYGWADLELNHHHWTTPQGMRFTVGPEAKEELLDRLLELNHERYAAEVAAGLHDKKAKKGPAKRSLKSAANQETLL